MKAKININKNIQLEITDNDEMQVLHKAIVLGNYPQKCSLCGETSVKIVSNKDKDGNVYVNAMCMKCGAKAKLGQYRSGGYFGTENSNNGKRKANQTSNNPNNK